jgi:hypothetical protein
LAHLSTETYLELLDRTGRQLRTGKRGRLAADLWPVLERLDLDVEAWGDNYVNGERPALPRCSLLLSGDRFGRPALPETGRTMRPACARPTIPSGASNQEHAW